MAKRYEIIDNEHPTWRGMRFTKVETAGREWLKCYPRERFYVIDRETGRVVRGSKTYKRRENRP